MKHLRLSLAFWLTFLFVLGGSAVALAQPTPVPPIDPFVTALGTHAYALAIALAVNWAVALTKAGWLSAWLAVRIPQRFLPVWAFLLAELGTVTTSVIGGLDWKLALLQGAEATAMAVFTHQLVIEGLFKGKEPVKPTAKVQAIRAAARIFPKPSIRPAA